MNFQFLAISIFLIFTLTNAENNENATNLAIDSNGREDLIEIGNGTKQIDLMNIIGEENDNGSSGLINILFPINLKIKLSANSTEMNRGKRQYYGYGDYGYGSYYYPNYYNNYYGYGYSYPYYYGGYGYGE